MLREFGVPFHCHYSQVPSNLDWKYRLGCYLLELFNFLLELIIIIIIISYLKPWCCMRIVRIREEYFIIIIIIIMSRCQHGSSWPSPAPVSIVHRSRQVFKVKSRIGTALLYIDSSWSSCLCSSMWRGPQKYVTYEFLSTSLAVSRMSGSSNLDSFRDRW